MKAEGVGRLRAGMVAFIRRGERTHCAMTYRREDSAGTALITGCPGLPFLMRKNHAVFCQCSPVKPSAFMASTTANGTSARRITTAH